LKYHPVLCVNASTSIREAVPTVKCLVFVRILCSQQALLTQSTEITSLCRQLVSNAVSKISLYTMYLSKYLTIYSSTSNQILDPLQAKLNQILLRLLPNVHPVECLNVGTLCNNRVQHMRAWALQSKQTKFGLFKVHFPPTMAIDFMCASLPVSPCALC